MPCDVAAEKNVLQCKMYLFRPRINPGLFQKMPEHYKRMVSAMCVHDFTAWCIFEREGDNLAEVPEERQNTTAFIKSLLVEHSKKWCFQLERCPETGRLHYQGRFSLKTKKRPGAEVARLFMPQMGDRPPWHFSLTSTENRDNDFYVSKTETREAGPWKDTDPEAEFFPIAQRELTLLPHQETFFRIADPNIRVVNIWYDHGHGGKSNVVAYAEYHKEGYEIPVFGTAKELLAAVCSLLSQRKERNPKRLFIDLPKAFKRPEDLRDIFLAIEKLKGGKAVDLRHKYQEWRFEPPQIWVFTNFLPPLDLLTPDRWRFWAVDKPINMADEVPTQLVPYMRNLNVRLFSMEHEQREQMREAEDNNWKAIVRAFKVLSKPKPQKAAAKILFSNSWGSEFYAPTGV